MAIHGPAYQPIETNVAGKGVLRLKELEVLFLHPMGGFFNFTSCSLPRLHTFYCGPFMNWWHTDVSPFLHKHGTKITVLDLDDFIITNPTPLSPKLILPVGFWELLPHLQILRISLSHTTFIELPNRDHPLEQLIDTGAVDYAEEFVDTVGIWSKRLEESGPSRITLHGCYVKIMCLSDVGGEVGAVLDGLKRHGTVLVDKAGKPFEYST
ncbi:hypothetical protein M408DRAFT_25065 [Serendipita vermifera MAFF 305830]|uniref:Uncharacterized protein n=1 Tax=Serendipita vermifera MAFF 305830 TaxID=933852 RepID=A0A0C3AQE0_SERVB|nr:hypothetical protein M408DRAFT_25065 [Serendipita vermifera MAFF 305830]